MKSRYAPLLLKITLIIFVIEGAIMTAFEWLSFPFHPTTEIVVDSLMLAALSTPLMYVFAIRPYVSRWHKLNEKLLAMRVQAETMVEDRTAELEAALYHEKKLSKAVDGLAESFVIFDPDDRITIANHAWRELNREVIGTTVIGTKFEDHMRALVEKGFVTKAIGREEEWLLERMEAHRNPQGSFELERQDDRWILVSEQRSPDHSTVLIINDITNQKHLEQSLKRTNDQLEQRVYERTKQLHIEVKERNNTARQLLISESRFRGFASAASDWLWEMGPDLRFSHFSDQATKRLGMSSDMLIGAPRQAFTQDKGWEAHIAVLDARRPFKDFEYEITSGLFVSVSGLPVFDDSGKFTGYRGTGKNITQRVNAEKELEQHRDHLEELVSQRTLEVQKKARQLEAALTREREYNTLQQKFVSLVSHEFRNPLAIIDGMAQRIIRRKGEIDPDEIVTRIGKVRSAVGRMINLIDTTLYASELDAGKIKMNGRSNNMRELLLEICDRYTEIAPDHQFNVEVEGLPRKMLFDGRLLDQVFTNLLSNAVKYAPQSPRIDIKGWQENEKVIITVADLGVGIPEKDLPHMFGRFFRAKTSEGIQGTGIGLSVCKEFVEIHGGSIEVVSIEGEGSTFTVQLPFVTEC